MSWIAVGSAVVGLYGANRAGKAAKEGAQASQAGTDASIEEQRRQFDITQGNMQGGIDAGNRARTQMEALNGGDFSSFQQSPDYQFAFDQGMQGLDRSAASRGSLYSGGADADRIKFGQGMANQNYGTYYSRLSDLATGGNATAGALGSLGANMANNIGNLTMGNVNAQRQSAYQRADAQGRGAAAVMGGLSNWQQNNSARNGGGTGWYFGNNVGKG